MQATARRRPAEKLDADAMWPMKDKNIHGTSDNQVQLFLGNEIYILACPARCHPEAAWPVPQN